MEFTGEIRLPATRQQVWDLLNDPAVLQRCIPGCTAIEKRNPTEFFANITAKVGPVTSSFSTQLSLDDLRTLKQEMIQDGLSKYQWKWNKENEVMSATTIEDLIEIEI